MKISSEGREEVTYEERAALMLSADATDLEIEDALITLYRGDNPRSRAVGLWRFTRNGTSTRVRECYFCDGRSQWCGKWPRTVESLKTEREDVEKHIKKVRSRLKKNFFS